MESLCDLETPKMEAARHAALAANPPPPSRLARWLDAFVKHAGAVPVDHTHMLPFGRISGRTGIFNPPAPRRCCC